MKQAYHVAKTGEPGNAHETPHPHLLMAEKARLFRQYQEATQMLKRGIQEEDGNSVMTFLKKRHQVINRIEGIDRLMNATFQDMDRKDLEDTEIPGAIGNTGELKELVENISMLENECVILVEAERNKIKKAVLYQRMNRKRQMQYKNFGAVTAKFINTQIR